MNKYIIDDYDKFFSAYPNYIKLFLIAQYISLHFGKNTLSRSIYEKLIDNFDYNKTALNTAASDDILSSSHFHGVTFNPKYNDYHAYKPLALRNDENKLEYIYFDNEDAVKELVDKYSEAIKKDGSNEQLDGLFNVINDNPGLGLSSIFNLIKNKDKNINISTVKKLLVQLNKDKKIKTQINEPLESPFAKYFAYDYKFNNSWKFLSLKQAIHDLVHDNEGIKRTAIISLIQMRYQFNNTEYISFELNNLINNKQIKKYAKNNNLKRTVYYTTDYFNSHINNQDNEDKELNNQAIRLTLLQLINKHPKYNKRELFKELPNKYTQDISLSQLYKLYNEVVDNGKINVNNDKTSSQLEVTKKDDKKIKHTNKKAAKSKTNTINQPKENTLKFYLFKFINSNPGINKKVLSKLFIEKYKYDAGNVYRSLGQMVDKKQVKIQDNIDTSSSFVNYYPADFKFTNDFQYKSPEDIVLTLSKKGTNKKELRDVLSQYYNISESYIYKLINSLSTKGLLNNDLEIKLNK